MIIKLIKQNKKTTDVVILEKENKFKELGL
jgi:hypothetical protein